MTRLPIPPARLLMSLLAAWIVAAFPNPGRALSYVNLLEEPVPPVPGSNDPPSSTHYLDTLTGESWPVNRPRPPSSVPTNPPPTRGIHYINLQTGERTPISDPPPLPPDNATPASSTPPSPSGIRVVDPATGQSWPLGTPSGAAPVPAASAGETVTPQELESCQARIQDLVGRAARLAAVRAQIEAKTAAAAAVANSKKLDKETLVGISFPIATFFKRLDQGQALQARIHEQAVKSEGALGLVKEGVGQARETINACAGRAHEPKACRNALRTLGVAANGAMRMQKQVLQAQEDGELLMSCLDAREGISKIIGKMESEAAALAADCLGAQTALNEVKALQATYAEQTAAFGAAYAGVLATIKAMPAVVERQTLTTQLLTVPKVDVSPTKPAEDTTKDLSRLMNTLADLNTDIANGKARLATYADLRAGKDDVAVIMAAGIAVDAAMESAADLPDIARKCKSTAPATTLAGNEPPAGGSQPTGGDTDPPPGGGPLGQVVNNTQNNANNNANNGNQNNQTGNQLGQAGNAGNAGAQQGAQTVNNAGGEAQTLQTTTANQTANTQSGNSLGNQIGNQVATQVGNAVNTFVGGVATAAANQTIKNTPLGNSSSHNPPVPAPPPGTPGTTTRPTGGNTGGRPGGGGRPTPTMPAGVTNPPASTLPQGRPTNPGLLPPAGSNAPAADWCYAKKVWDRSWPDGDVTKEADCHCKVAGDWHRSMFRWFESTCPKCGGPWGAAP